MWPPTEEFHLPLQQLVVDNRTIKGSFMGASTPRRDIPRYIELFQRGLLPIDKLLSTKVRIDDANQALDVLEEGRAVRQVIVFN
jgi:alcohol dehydrogenase